MLGPGVMVATNSVVRKIGRNDKSMAVNATPTRTEIKK
jgi:hypothetical protein